ncbi:MAG: class I SAM-dependent methyltransferase, partial [Alphaproteobacteria bacterium]
MEASLGHPDYGYYNRQQPFGREGDFTTAPEISQMFGELIGLWCADVWMKLGSPMKFHLVELGPGNGTLMADLLRSAKLVPPFLAAANLHLVEMSDRLRSRQSETLAGTPLTWHDELPEVEDAPVILIANEFFDALPIHSYERKESDWYERLVTYEDDALFFILADQPSVL